MIRKHKIIIAVSIISVVALTLGLILGGLDRLDAENYGLNYNTLSANFSDEGLYSGGMHLVGPGNILLEVPKVNQVIVLKNIKTFTQDFFPVQIGAEVSYAPDITQNTTDVNKFKIARDFYINFGAEPQKILYPLVKNEIIKIISNRASSDFKIADIFQTLQLQISASIQNIVKKWSQMKVLVLLSSIVCKGVSIDLETLNRKINSLNSQSQRIQARKTDITKFANATQQYTKIKMKLITDSLQNTALALSNLNVPGLKMSYILGRVEAVAQDLKFASSQLELIPSLYLINGTEPV